MEGPDFRVPCTAAFEYVTPELARKWLDSGNSRNRNLIPSAVSRIQGILERDEWLYDSTDAIGLTSDETVVNGQHRLTAIAESGIAAWILVVRGVRRQVITVIDQPAPRTFRQTLDISGDYASPQEVDTAVKWLYKMIFGFERKEPTQYKPTQPQLLDLLLKHRKVEDSTEAAAALHAKRVTANKLSAGILTAYHYAFASVDPDLADDFYNQLANGEGLAKGDPVYTLRERFLADRGKSRDQQMSAYTAVAFLVKTWEAFRRGSSMHAQALRFIASGPNAERVPVVTDVDWLAGRFE